MSIALLIQQMAEAGAPPKAIAIAVAAIEALEAIDEQRRERKRVGNRERQQRHRAVTRDKALHERDITRDPLKQKERVPPTPPLLEKLNSPWIDSSNEESIVAVPDDVNEINEIGERRRHAVTLFQTVVGMWNEMAANCRLIAVRDITPTRQAAVLARSEDLVKTYEFPDAIEGWRKLMGLVRGSPFLRGELNGFRCDFDFVTRASSFTKIMEGKYEARQAAKRR
jgi:hypothetical protein